MSARTRFKHSLSTSEVLELMEAQRTGHNADHNAQQCHIAYLGEQVEDLGAQVLIYYEFFGDNKELIPKLVEFVYRKNSRVVAKEVVESLHDLHYDLSTLACTGNDFEPWKEDERV